MYSSTHPQLPANELVAFLDSRPADTERVPDGKEIESMPAPLRHRESGRDAALPQRLDGPLAHGEGKPVVTVAVDHEGGCLVVALLDLPQRADGLDLLRRCGGPIPPVRGVRGGDVVFVGETIDEDLDRLRLPTHVQDDLGAVVLESQREGHGSLFTDGSVFDDLHCTVSLFVTLPVLSAGDHLPVSPERLPGYP